MRGHERRPTQPRGDRPAGPARSRGLPLLFGGFAVSRLRVEVYPAAQGNYGSARANTPVDTLVIHTTESQRTPERVRERRTPSAVLWFGDPASGVSAHYTLGRDGTVWQSVAEGDCAWHAGNAAVNRRSIGIEVEGFAGRAETWTPEVMAALVTLSAEIVERHGIPILRQPGPGICGHCDVPNPRDPLRRGGLLGKVDPGPYFPWLAFLDAIRSELVEIT
jgi:N-acetylmuramoyl-L-alanine amidase